MTDGIVKHYLPCTYGVPAIFTDSFGAKLLTLGLPSRLMSPATAAAVAALVATEFGLGWCFGFPLRASLVFWLLSGLAAFAAWRVTRALFPWTGLVDAIVRAATIAFAAVVFIGMTLGNLGLIGTVPYLTAFAVASAATLLLRPWPARKISTPRLPVHVAMIVLPMLAFIVAVGLVQSPLTLYDSVSYHLVFPAQWLQDHRLSIVATPFSDPAQAYQPGHGELFFLWLLLPFHGDLLARIGQLPFLLLGALSLYAIARRCGVRADHAAYAPLFFVLTRPVVEQAVGADVDLICAATFLASIHLGIAAVESDAPRDWALWGVIVGLFLGSKYLALVYVPVLLVLPLLRGPRLRALWAIPGLIAFGLPWYARNWIVTGSPIYPASLKVLGIVVSRGAFTRDAMNNSVFHVTSLRLLPAIVAHAFGAATALVWLPWTCVGLVVFAAHRRWWPGAYIAAVPFAIVLLFWLAVPDNADSRFLLSAAALGMVPLTFSFGKDRRWNACLHAAYTIGAAWILVGTPRQLPMRLPWFMGDWLSLEGIVSHASLPMFGALVAAVACLAYVTSRRPAYAAPLLTAAFGAACLVVATSARAAYARDGSSLLSLSPTYIRAGMIAAWDWAHQNIAHATIANSGNNVPYPLFEDDLTNRVRYVNIDRHTDWRFHDYARGRKAGPADAPGRLATASGQLMPLPPGRPVDDASRPRYERWDGFREAWLANLKSAAVTHLFVSVLSAYEIDFVWHNAGGFPIEDDWARADPGAFRLVYANDQVRIYAVSQP
jgi:hypothetical protein